MSPADGPAHAVLWRFIRPVKIYTNIGGVTYGVQQYWQGMCWYNHGGGGGGGLNNQPYSEDFPALAKKELPVPNKSSKRRKLLVTTPVIPAHDRHGLSLLRVKRMQLPRRQRKSPRTLYYDPALHGTASPLPSPPLSPLEPVFLSRSTRRKFVMFYAHVQGSLTNRGVMYYWYYVSLRATLHTLTDSISDRNPLLFCALFHVSRTNNHFRVCMYDVCVMRGNFNQNSTSTSVFPPNSVIWEPPTCSKHVSDSEKERTLYVYCMFPSATTHGVNSSAAVEFLCAEKTWRVETD